MRSLATLFTIAGTLVSPLAAGEGVVDLTRLENYGDQRVPSYINRDNTPGNNEITDLGATLGRVLFHDKRLSRNDTISCSSCHQQAQAFGDLSRASTGVAGTTGRHSMRLVNARFGNEVRFFWDERAGSLEAQSTQPIRDHVEMGFSGTNGDPDFGDLVEKLSAIEEYRVLFTGVYGDPVISEIRIQRALAQFVRSIQSFDSKYDAGRSRVTNDNSPFPNYTVEENAGKRLFMTPPNVGGAGCAECHQPPEFSIVPNSGNNGITGSLGGASDFTVTRSPTLRDVVDAEGLPHGGFMHDASRPSLRSVIAHYNAIPALVPGLDRRLTRPGGPPGPAGDLPQRLNLDGQEIESLVAFLETLTGTNVYTDPKWSDPFDGSGQLRLIVLPAALEDITRSADEVTLRSTGVPNLAYRVQWSADLSFSNSAPVVADTNGDLVVSVPVSPGEDRMFYRFVYEPGSGGVSGQ